MGTDFRFFGNQYPFFLPLMQQQSTIEQFLGMH